MIIEIQSESIEFCIFLSLMLIRLWFLSTARLIRLNIVLMALDVLLNMTFPNHLYLLLHYRFEE